MVLIGGTEDLPSSIRNQSVVNRKGLSSSDVDLLKPIFRTPTGGEAGFEELVLNIW